MSAVLARPPGARRREAALAALVVLGLAAVFSLSAWYDGRRPAFDPGDAEEEWLTAGTLRRLSGGFHGLLADWYWLQALQYIGRKIQEQAGGQVTLEAAYELDRIRAVNPRVLARLLDATTTLDPRFTAVYEFAAVVLPAVDVAAAVRLVEKGIQVHPESWYLHQQLAYIHWQHEDYAAAAAAFRRGARLTDAKWMADMAVLMEERGPSRAVAVQMYSRMYEQATDEAVKTWALGRLAHLRWLEDRDALRDALAAYYQRAGRCPVAWADLAPALRALRLRTDPRWVPLDPSGLPYVLVIRPGGCDVVLHPDSRVPPK